ncbi:heavy-metal-associated domain-containing protein [Aliifodinibius sp. S!AR15-10]|uniref:heavy-metal-associated domain-containing protein n=1 Tax=Aliifodinibius sp. S!AR15-10 TaxID=2950437 RepID=UPI002862C6AE|nr:heavy-metal-associated domain-containing protein [Aliifodinibius sp. S!AR15-10]MDR8390486.1 heavy-metal-associated domain-containing protein [Aliifodinibius sp. S!AR15-10]
MMKSTAALLTFILIVIGFSSASLAQNKASNDQTKTVGEQISLQIEGMACSMCEQNCKRSLEKLKGVKVKSISSKEGIAKLTYKGSNPISDETIKEAVENAGYKLTKIQRKDSNESDGETKQ